MSKRNSPPLNGKISPLFVSHYQVVVECLFLMYNHGYDFWGFSIGKPYWNERWLRTCVKHFLFVHKNDMTPKKNKVSAVSIVAPSFVEWYNILPSFAQYISPFSSRVQNKSITLENATSIARKIATNVLL